MHCHINRLIQQRFFDFFRKIATTFQLAQRPVSHFVTLRLNYEDFNGTAEPFGKLLGHQVSLNAG